jgi:hypothetical protein
MLLLLCYHFLQWAVREADPLLQTSIRKNQPRCPRPFSALPLRRIQCPTQVLPYVYSYIHIVLTKCAESASNLEEPETDAATPSIKGVSFQVSLYHNDPCAHSLCAVIHRRDKALPTESVGIRRSKRASHSALLVRSTSSSSPSSASLGVARKRRHWEQRLQTLRQHCHEKEPEVSAEEPPPNDALSFSGEGWKLYPKAALHKVGDLQKLFSEAAGNVPDTITPTMTQRHTEAAAIQRILAPILSACLGWSHVYLHNAGKLLEFAVSPFFCSW